MGPGYTFEVSRVLDELGIKVVWALAWHYDKKYENGDVPPSIPRPVMPTRRRKRAKWRDA